MEYETIEKTKIPLGSSELSKFISNSANQINDLHSNNKIISFETYGMKLRGKRGYKIIFLLKKE